MNKRLYLVTYSKGHKLLDEEDLRDYLLMKYTKDEYVYEYLLEQEQCKHHELMYIPINLADLLYSGTFTKYNLKILSKVFGIKIKVLEVEQ